MLCPSDVVAETAIAGLNLEAQFDALLVLCGCMCCLISAALRGGFSPSIRTNSGLFVG